jgi:hypothetical protein
VFAYYPLWEVVSKSALVVRGACAGVAAPHVGRLRVLEALRGAPPGAEIEVRAPAPTAEAPKFFWREGEEAAVALPRAEPPYEPTCAYYGIWSLAPERGGEARLGTIRDMCQLYETEDPREGAEALAAMLRRPAAISRAAALEALRDSPRARRSLVPPLDAEVIALTRDRDAALRRMAVGIAGTLPRERALVEALLERLADEDEGVRRDANGALVRLTEQDFGFDAAGPRDRRAISIARWHRWHAAEPR